MRTWMRRRVLASAVSTASAAGLTAATAVPARAAGRAGDDDVVDALRSLPGLRVIEERPGAEPGYRHFVLGLRQPVDHTDRAAGAFEQRLTLLHTAADRPTVLFTTGYEAVLTPRRTEATVLLDGNQLEVEHRFFGTSRPAALDYTHLTIRQAADDHHRVVRLFRRLYPGAWIPTGGSKGGMASVYHRRFHPHDVDGTVVYSAPNNVDDRDDSAHQDPSVAEPFRPGAHDSRVLWVAGGNHHVTLGDLSPTDRAEAVATLTRWATGRVGAGRPERRRAADRARTAGWC